VFLSDDNVDKFFDVILEKLTLEASKKKELKTFVQTLSSTLKNFRHNPAHCGTIIENALRAESDFFTLLNTMDNITQSLIDAGVIPFGGYRIDPKKTAAEMAERKKLASL
jgi:phosphate uptake regulator